jgi:hypothetical protein
VVTPKNTLAALPTTLPRGTSPLVKPALAYLLGAHKSVNALLDSLSVVRSANMKAAKKDRGRLTNDELELLRAALVFSSSGLDASLHRLVRDTLPTMALTPSSGAAAQFQQYRKTSAQQGSGSFVAAVTATDPLAAMLQLWVDDRIKGSYQGSSDLRLRVRAPLGIPSSAISDQELSALDPFFMARNRVVHDMDYEDVTAGRTRHHRKQDATIAECDQVFAVARKFIIETAKALP